MDGVLTILENSPGLTEQEMLEILNLGWLFRHAPPSIRERAMRRIRPLFKPRRVDGRLYMARVREIGVELQKALEERVKTKVAAVETH